MPRVGFSYSHDASTVIRGLGMYFGSWARRSARYFKPASPARRNCALNDGGVTFAARSPILRGRVPAPKGAADGPTTNVRQRPQLLQSETRGRRGCPMEDRHPTGTSGRFCGRTGYQGARDRDRIARSSALSRTNTSAPVHSRPSHIQLLAPICPTLRRHSRSSMAWTRRR